MATSAKIKLEPVYVLFGAFGEYNGCSELTPMSLQVLSGRLPNHEHSFNHDGEPPE